MRRRALLLLMGPLLAALGCNVALGLSDYVYQDTPPPPPPPGDPGKLLWVDARGGPGVDLYSSVTVGSAGEIVVAGCASDDQGVIPPCGTHGGSLVRRFSSDGTLLWQHAFGDQFSLATTLMVGSEVVVGGFFQGSMSVGADTLNGGDAGDAYVAKFETAKGIPLAMQAFGSPGQPQILTSVRNDGQGGLLLAGTFQGTIAFGGAPLLAVGAPDSFFAHLSATGAEVRSESYFSVPAGHQVVVTCLAPMANGDVVLGGRFNGTVDFGPGPMIADNAGDAFLVRLDSAGKALWSKRFGVGGVFEEISSLAVDAQGAIYITGELSKTIDFGGAVLTSRGGLDVFFAKLDGSGAHQWSSSFGDVGDDRALSIAAFADGVAVVAGLYQGVVPIAGKNLESVGQTDAFVVKVGADGAPVWARSFGGSGADAAYGVALDADKNILVAGYFSGDADFGDKHVHASGVTDAFLLKLTP